MVFKNNIKVKKSDPLYLKSKVTEIIIEQGEDDFSFQEYIDGIYIPKNLIESLIEIDKFLKPTDKEKIKLQTETEFTSQAHFGQGLWIRNNWALWKGSRLYHFFKSKGISHPDNISGIILTSYYRKLNGIEIELDKQIEKYKK